MASGDYSRRVRAPAEESAEALFDDNYIDEEFDDRPSARGFISRGSPARSTRRVTRPFQRTTLPSIRSARFMPSTLTIERVRPASKGNTLLNPFIFVPYIVGLVVIIYYSCVGVWIGVTWLLGIWPYIAKSDLLPPLANIAGIIQGIAIIVGSLLGILKLFNQRQKS